MTKHHRKQTVSSSVFYKRGTYHGLWIELNITLIGSCHEEFHNDMHPSEEAHVIELTIETIS